MTNATAAKLLRVFVPLPLLALALVAVLSLFNWLLVAGTGILPIDEEVVDVWLPGGLAVVLVFALIHPRLRLLALNEKRSVPLLFDIAAMVAVAVPAIVAQGYVHDATGTLLHVADAALVTPGTPARYFTADRVCLDRDKLAADVAFGSSGRNGETLTMDLYVAVPACRADAAKPAVWIGFRYRDGVSRNSGDAKLDAEYKAFLQHSQDALNAEDASRYRYLERVLPGAELRNFAKALRKRHLDPEASVILMPRTEPFEQRTGHRLAWLFGSFAAGTLLWLALVLIAPLAPGGALRAVEAQDDAEAREDAFLVAFFLPTRRSYALPLLLDANILVYLAMMFSGLGVTSFQTDDLLDWGANYGPYIHGLGVLRLFTSQFVHGGLMHLASNMYGLLFAAIFLSPASTNPRLIAWYLLCGLGGSLASITVHPAIVSVGASGAIFGLFGIALTLSLLRDRRFGEAGRFIWTNAAIFVVLNLVFGAAVPAIDNAAHVGGLLTGLAIGAATYFYDRERV